MSEICAFYIAKLFSTKMAENHCGDLSQSNQISKFYAGKTIFITGAAGFLGTILLECLLRCCPDISRIYILLRSKKGVQAEDRKNFIFKKDIFIQLKATNPDALKKVIVVSGDTSQENLGLNENDFSNLTSEVSIVFHVAATISFIKTLSFTVRNNVISTSNIIGFCRRLKKLEALVYTSSVYSCCNQKDVMEEKIYDLPFSPSKVVKFGRYDDEYQLTRLFNMCNPPFPNFYTFSKCVAENLLKENAQDLPVCIIRPSIIFSCLKGPLPGNVERGSAIADLVEGVGTGFIRIIRIDKHKKMQIIPADVVANSHIIAAFHQAIKSLPSPYVYNCVSGELFTFTWADFAGHLILMTRKNPLSQAFMYPMIVICKNLTLYNFLSLMLHYIPAVTVDFILSISGKKIRLLEIYKFYNKTMRSVDFFTMHDWDMRNENFRSLSKGLNAFEKKMFCIDLKDFTMDEVLRNLITGAQFYRVNGKPYQDKFKQKCLRYFLTFLYVSFVAGITASVLYLVFYNIMG